MPDNDAKVDALAALEQRLSRERENTGGKSRAERMRAFLDRIADERKPGAPGSDYSWMYDENGLPI